MASEIIPAGNDALTGDVSGTDYWGQIYEVELDPKHLADHLLISAARENPAHMAFDILRTRLLQAMSDKGWSKIGVTSPTAGCGKTFVAVNLAISLARREGSRTLLMDMDLRDPGIATVLGIGGEHILEDYLSGHINPEDHFLRIGDSLAVALNSAKIARSAEIFQEDMTDDVLSETQELLAPEVTLFDLPPALTSDEVLAFMPHLDGVLLVIGGGETTEEEIRAVEQLLEGHVPLIGVVLNRSEDKNPY